MNFNKTMMILSLILMSITSIMFMIHMISNKFKKNMKKLTPFECGFNPFNPPKSPFSIQFFKILLIFLIFDMEIIVILPFPLKFNSNKMTMFWFLLIMIILMMGLYFEWKEGSLKWLK